MATLLPEGKQSFTDAAGVPLVGGKVYTYDAGTTTPRPTYADSAQTTPNTNPVILDARGEATIYWNGSYKVILRDANDVLIWTVDNIQDTGEILATALRADLANTSDVAKGDALVGVKYEAPAAVAINLHTYIEDDGRYNVMGFIPNNLKAAIRNRTSTTDVHTYAQAWIDAMIADDRSGWMPRGRYVAPGLMLSGYLGNGLRIDGAGAVIRLGANETGLTIDSSENVFLGRGIRFDSTAASGTSQIGVKIVDSGRLEIAGEYSLLTYGIEVVSTRTGLATGPYQIPMKLSPIVKACAAGVYCAPAGEYVDIVNMLAQDCTVYGAIVEAGNVHVLGGTFSGNSIGMMFDGAATSNGDHGSIVGATINHNAKAGIVLRDLDFSMLVTGNNVWAHISQDYGAAPYDTSIGVALIRAKNVNLTSNVIANNKTNLSVETVTGSIIRSNVFIADSLRTTFNIKEITALGAGVFNSVGDNAFFGALVGGANNNATDQFFTPTYLNSWVPFGGVLFQQPKYWKDGSGTVHLTGVMKNGVMANSAFQLPQYFRPTAEIIFPVVSNDLFARVHVQTDGNVIPRGGSNAYVSLDGITFRAET